MSTSDQNTPIETATNLVQSAADDAKRRAGTVQTEVVERGREVWLASLGAVASAADEAQRLVSTVLGRAQQAGQDTAGLYRSLVERGEESEADAKRQLAEAVDSLSERQEALSEKLGELADRARTQTASAGERVDEAETSVKRGMDAVLNRLDAPSRTEIRDLTTKIDALASKVNALAKALDENAQAEVAAVADAADATETRVMHVVTHDDGWAVKEEGNAEPMQTFGTKAEALDVARTVAKAQVPSRLVIHRMDGTIQDSTTYEA